MDKQKLVTRTNIQTKKQSKVNFPIVDAMLLTPEQGEQGVVGICTNTSASGQVYNEVDQNVRSHVSVLGSLIVNRDGTERMILNSLAHPTLKYLVLFSEESLTFSPSTNLLQVLKNGFDKNRNGNYVKDGKGAAPQYPNLNEKLVNIFREEIITLPLFMFRNNFSQKLIGEYLEWLQPRVDEKIYQALKKINEKDKIYYDALNEFIDVVARVPAKSKNAVALDPKDFPHLQLPRIELKDKNIVPKCPFHVTREGLNIHVNLKVGKEALSIEGQDDFLIGYSLMKALGEKKNLLSPQEQLFLGVELGRVKTEIVNNLKFPSFVKSESVPNKTAIPLESNLALKVDGRYYYKIGLKDTTISVACLAYDVCEEVFELRTKTAAGLLERLAQMNRFEDYPMDILHRIDIGTQVARAAIAAKLGYNFIQDFDTLFKINTKKLPLLVSEGDSFLDVHKSVVRKIYTQGLTEEHGDAHKGLARSAITLAIYRDSPNSLRTLPNFYRQGVESTETMREEYKKQLLRFDHDGSYSYGQRTRTFFGYDQLKNTIKVLKKNPGRATVIQRFDPKEDMMFFPDESGKGLKFTHDPCLTHDVFFMRGTTLHSFHIARAHNTVNAYPENIFGIFDAYVSMVRDGLKAQGGDMYMLSNRANILLLTEEQRTRKILSEPSKPAHNLDTSSGPYLLGKNMKESKNKTGVFYVHQPIKKVIKRPKSKTLERLENYHGVNVLDKAISYLKIRGGMHNNSILSEYQARIMDPQGEYLLFFQANVFGKKLHASAVYVNHPIRKIQEDLTLCNYLATQYGKTLKYPLGNLTMFYIIA